MDTISLPATIEPNTWFVVFSERWTNRWLAMITPGRFKHVAMFGYCPGVKLWLAYDVQWSGTRIALMDKAAIMQWTQGCAVVQIAAGGDRMAASSRLGLYCVNAVKHLLRLRCVAATPCQLYRHILRHGGRLISDLRPARPAARTAADAADPGPGARSDAGPGAAAGAAGSDQVVAVADPS
jgi:hypothetical protein